MEHFIVELFVRGLALCLLTALTLLLLRRAAAACRHLLCVLALGGLLALPLAQRLLPPLPVLKPQPMATFHQGTLPTEAADRTAAGNATSALPSLPDTSQSRMVQPQSTTLLPQDNPLLPPPRRSAVIRAPRQERSWNTAAGLAAIWGLGTFMLLIRLMVALWRLRRLKSESRETMRGDVPILVSERIDTPLTWGIWRKVILLPATLLSGDPAVCESALRHELAHIARWDWIWNLLAEVICAVCWFQPGVWWLRRRMRLESERACDDRVLLSGVDGPDYAAHLLQILRSVRSGEIAPAMAHSGSMEERMRHILDTHKPRRSQTKWLAVSASLAPTLLCCAALRVSARPADAKTPADPDAAVLQSRRPIMPSRPLHSPLPNADSGTMYPAVLPFLVLPSLSGNPPADTPVERANGGRGFHLGARIVPDGAVAPQPGSAPSQGAPPAAATPVPGPLAPLGRILWGDAVDGVQPGFLLKAPGLADTRRMPFNSQVTYQVLVRNTSRQERGFEVQCKDFHEMGLSWIPDAELHKALGSRSISSNYRVIELDELVDGYLGSVVKLAPGEAVLLPEELHLYVGDAKKESYPRIEQIKPGKNWLVQPIMARALTPEETAEDLASITSPYGNGINLTILMRDGSAVKRLGAQQGIRGGSRKLYAKMPLQIAAVNAANAPAEKPIQWGETVRGFQLGARIAQGGSVFQTGEVIAFQPFGRNLSGKAAELTVGRYWKVNYKIQVQTLDGEPVYMERDRHNQAMLVAGYMAEPLADGATQEISEAKLRITRPSGTRQAGVSPDDADTWVEAVPLKPGRYRVRLMSWGVFGPQKNGPLSGWIPIEVKN